MSDETKVEEKDEQAQSTNAQAPALRNPVLLGRKLGMLQHFKDLPPMRVLREVRLDDIDGFATGQEIGVDRFAAGDKVHVSGVSKGKGFQGPVHLHHFTR